jgi:phage terminase large subunit
LQRQDENLQTDIIELVSQWQIDPYRYCIEALGVRPTNQQKDLLEQLGQLVNVKIKKWISPSECTAEENELAKKIGISVMSGKGTGKDAVLSWCILWFLTCFHNSKIPMTGPSRDQMRTVLMAEIAKWVNRLDKDGEPAFIFHDNVVVQSDTVYMKDPANPEQEGKSWFARLRTAPRGARDDLQSKAMDGLHEDFMMVAVDEADGVPLPILTSLETTLTSPVNFMLLIFNPTKSYGYAFETQFGTHQDYFIKLHWDSRESENVTADHIEKIKRTHGEDSPEYRVNVLGLPPEQTPDTLIPQEWVDNAIDRDITPDEKAPRVMGIDPSRQGGDPAGVLIRDGWLIRDLIEFRKLDTLELADEIAALFIEWECDVAYIDTIGNGAGVYDVLKRRFPGKIRPVDVSTKPRDNRKKFNRLRDELWWKVRTLFEHNAIAIPKKVRLHKKLCNELSIMKRDHDDDSQSGKIKVESKAKMKSRGMKSPNLADALMVTTAANDAAFKTDEYRTDKRKKKDPYDEPDAEFSFKPGDNSWMLA